MNKLNLANKHTRIEKVGRYKNRNIYIKRDDQTGFELSGNKIRKLEYSLKEALDLKKDTIITCGGIQSNHARCAAIASVKLGLEVHLVLKDNEAHQQGNYFLDELIGAKIHIISIEEYANRQVIMENLKKELEKEGKSVYIIPEGASNGIGNFGYMNCFYEIEEQEKELGLRFDYIVSTFGSGSTYTGLLIGSKKRKREIKHIGYNIYNKEADTKKMVKHLVEMSKQYEKMPLIEDRDIHVNADYVGLGYAKSTKKEMDFIIDFARKYAIILDTVYTGKAMYGLFHDIEKYKEDSNILFIHTGGVFGNFSKTELFRKEDNK